MKTSSLLFWTVAACFAVSCQPEDVTGPRPLPQRGYLWQRDWTSAVEDALTAAQENLQGVVLLGAEIEWLGGKPRVVRANVAWEKVKESSLPCSIALRVAPFSSRAVAPDVVVRAIAEVAISLLSEAQSHGVKIEELQLDYDCAQKNLANYQSWLHRIRAAVRPHRFVITALPAWLDEPGFAGLLEEVDGYVLQVHSVPTTNGEGAKLCDPEKARSWVVKAARLRRSFSVALPTYRCTAGYDEAGKLIGVAMDSVQPSWPPATRQLNFASDADAISTLVHEWQTARPAAMRELLWYRIPVATDTRNWRWPTLHAVMAGRKPVRDFQVISVGENPVDLSLRNGGESDDENPVAIVAHWKHGELVAADALAGWEVRAQKLSAQFTTASSHPFRLPPGAERGIGWLRYASPVRPELVVQK